MRGLVGLFLLMFLASALPANALNCLEGQVYKGWYDVRGVLNPVYREYTCVCHVWRLTKEESGHMKYCDKYQPGFEKKISYSKWHLKSDDGTSRCASEITASEKSWYWENKNPSGVCPNGEPFEASCVVTDQHIDEAFYFTVETWTDKIGATQEVLVHSTPNDHFGVFYGDNLKKIYCSEKTSSSSSSNSSLSFSSTSSSEAYSSSSSSGGYYGSANYLTGSSSSSDSYDSSSSSDDQPVVKKLGLTSFSRAYP